MREEAPEIDVIQPEAKVGWGLVQRGTRAGTGSAQRHDSYDTEKRASVMAHFCGLVWSLMWYLSSERHHIKKQASVYMAYIFVTD